MASEQPEPAAVRELADFINAQLEEQDGPGSDLQDVDVQDDTWTYVEGNLDVAHLAGALLYAGWRKA